MELLHAIFAFNLVTSLGILGGAYLIHRQHDTMPAKHRVARRDASGVYGAAMGLVVVSAVATHFL